MVNCNYKKDNDISGIYAKLSGVTKRQLKHPAMKFYSLLIEEYLIVFVIK